MFFNKTNVVNFHTNIVISPKICNENVLIMTKEKYNKINNITHRYNEVYLIKTYIK